MQKREERVNGGKIYETGNYNKKNGAEGRGRVFALAARLRHLARDPNLKPGDQSAAAKSRSNAPRSTGSLSSRNTLLTNSFTL
jgi:hypothetical protein